MVLDRIRVAGRELLDLVQTTLDLNRLESGQDPAVFEPIGMQALWDELAGQYAALERPAGVGLRWEVVGAPSAYTDRRKLKIVVKNLVGNALKFTSEGEVCATVRATGDRCIVTVRDTGIGIPTEHLGNVFACSQVDASDSRANGGVARAIHRAEASRADRARLEVRSTVGWDDVTCVAARRCGDDRRGGVSGGGRLRAEPESRALTHRRGLHAYSACGDARLDGRDLPALECRLR